MSAMSELNELKRVVPTGLVTVAMLLALLVPWAKGNEAATAMCAGALDRVLYARYRTVSAEVTFHIGRRSDNGEPFVTFKGPDGKYKKACLSALARRLERELEHGGSARRPITWKVAVEEFMTRCSRGSENRNGHPKTLQDQWREQTVLGRLAARFGGRPVHATTYADLRAYIGEREQQPARCKQTPLARATINKEIATITRFFNWLEAEEHIERNPARRLKQGKTSNTRSHMAPSMQELRVWREHIPADKPDVRDFFDVAVNTGMRASEILGLRPEYYRPQEQMLYLPHPKEQKPASIPLNPRVQPIIERRAAVGTEWLFQRPDDRRLTLDVVRDVLYRARVRAGITRRYWVHDLRRAFATMAYAHSGLLETQALLRHSTPVVTRRYIAVPDAALRGTVNRMAADWGVEGPEDIYGQPPVTCLRTET